MCLLILIVLSSHETQQEQLELERARIAMEKEKLEIEKAKQELALKEQQAKAQGGICVILRNFSAT